MSLVKIEKIVDNEYLSTQVYNGSKWLPTRGENYRFDGIRSRLKQAWGVLIGRYDALDWGEKQRNK